MTWMMLIVLTLVLWAAVRELPAGMDGHQPLPYLIALVRFLWIPAGLAAILAASVGDWASAVVAVLLLLGVNVLGLGHYRRRGRKGSQEADSRRRGRRASCRVMTLNCHKGAVDADAVVTAVRTRSIDVLALQELTGDLVDRLEKAGLDALLPHRQLGRDLPDDNGGFNGVWSKSSPTKTETDAVDIPAADTPALTLSLAGRPVRFVSAHTKSPHRGCRQWSQGIMGLGKLADSSRRRGVVILGDLNSSLDHPSFRALLKSGFRDAALVQAAGPVVSYPAWLPWPRIELDHVLMTPGIDVAEVVSGPVKGTDHLAVYAHLAV